ncbi:MAG: hypothetical protein MI924_01125 [Chloroflexales bacterium]|nr:hypothetical protein [Chloroflexales bacterium]
MESVPKEVLTAFQCAGVPEKLPGSEGNSFVVENIVFKPIHDIERYEWASEILLRMPQTGFRISKPRKSIEEKCTYGGWGATTYEPGNPINGRWSQKLDVCRAFHTAIQSLSIVPMPASSDRWSQAHKIAWQETSLPPTIHPEIHQLIGPIYKKYQVIERSDQIIHGDMCGNILFEAELEPVVIDFSPGYGPKEYAEAILVADAIAWENAPVELMRALPQTTYINQMLIRAVNFRLIVAALFYPMDVVIFKQEYENFVPLLQRLA